MHDGDLVSDLLLPLLGQAVAEGRVDLEDVLAAARARDGERLADLMDQRCAVSPHPGFSFSPSRLRCYLIGYAPRGDHGTAVPCVPSAQTPLTVLSAMSLSYQSAPHSTQRYFSIS